MAAFPQPALRPSIFSRNIKTWIKFPHGPNDNTTAPAQLNIPGSATLVVSTAFTISFWWICFVKPSSSNNVASGAMFSYQNASLNNGVLVIKASGGGIGGLRLNTINSLGTALNFNNTNAILKANAIYQTVLTYNGSVLQLYTNGVTDSAAQANAVGYTYTSSDPIQFGGANNGNTSVNSQFLGLISQIKYYNVALSAGDVSLLYLTGTSSQEANLEMYLKCNEGRGTTVHDYSGNGNNGTLKNTASWFISPQYNRIQGHMLYNN